MSISRKLYFMGDAFCRFLFPNKCICCDDIISAKSHLCDNCLLAYQEEKKRSCPLCYKPIGECACSFGYLKKEGVKHQYKAFGYLPGQRERVQNQLIYALKDAHLKSAAEFLAEEMEKTLQFHEIDYHHLEIAYIPASKKRLREKGYDQMKMLARALSFRLHIPVAHVIYRAKQKTAPQKTLSRWKRWANAKGTYAIKPKADVSGKSYLLIDDVVTTGSTLFSAMSALKDAGAKQVLILTAAETVTTRKVPKKYLIKHKQK